MPGMQGCAGANEAACQCGGCAGSAGVPEVFKKIENESALLDSGGSGTDRGCAYFPVCVWIAASKHKLVKALAALSVCTVLLVGTIQVVLYYLMDIGGIWFMQIGLPITLLWIAVVWAGVAFHSCFHMNALISLAVISFLAIPGNYFTDYLAGDYRGVSGWDIGSIADGLGNGIAAGLLLTVGIILEMRKRKKENGE